MTADRPMPEPSRDEYLNRLLRLANENSILADAHSRIAHMDYGETAGATAAQHKAMESLQELWSIGRKEMARLASLYENSVRKSLLVGTPTPEGGT